MQKLDTIGYVFEGDLGVKDRYAFKYQGEKYLPKHHLYVCPKTSMELKRHVIFRDYFRSHPSDAALYEKVKKEAAKLYPNDIDKYIKHKASIIADLYKKCGLE